MPYFVYILYSEKCDKFYIGQTKDLDQRLAEHNSGKGGQFTSSCLPWVLKYSEVFQSRVDALKREREIKSKKSRKYIEWLIASG